MALTDRYKNNNKNSIKIKKNSKKKNPKNNGRKGKVKDKDDMDKKIDYINTLNDLDKLTTKNITKFEGEWSYFIAEYFKEKLNINQLRDIHQLLKNIEQKISNNNCTWNDIKLDYNLLKLNINLKNERFTIPYKFYQLIYSFINIIDKVAENKKIEHLQKVMIMIDAMVGYHKYINKQRLNKNNSSLKDMTLKINSKYMLDITKKENYVNDTKIIANSISKDKNVTIHQLRKIFNVYKSWEKKLDDNWSNIEEDYYLFYPKLAYMTGRGLITDEFFKLIVYCMDIIDTGDNKDKILKFKNYIKYYEAIISYYTYQNVKNEVDTY
ncbi:MAG: type III-A CRISPR-associated protein Csm2 [Methanosphaera sp.]|nr:type III-A CRISPR-associated protein Csm2 [Methanosphaera sp.]